MSLTSPRDRSKVLIVGLGNPGAGYSTNRHNLGFQTLDRLASRHGLVFDDRRKNAEHASGRIRRRQVVLAKPQTYMNLSGESVGPLLRLFEMDPRYMMVVYDELDLPFGTLRLRSGGSAGGHRGMVSILEVVPGTFARVRLGIGRPPEGTEISDYVIQDFKAEELPVRELLLDSAVEAVETTLEQGLTTAMSRYNGSVLPSEDHEKAGGDEEPTDRGPGKGGGREP